MDDVWTEGQIIQVAAATRRKYFILRMREKRFDCGPHLNFHSSHHCTDKLLFTLHPHDGPSCSENLYMIFSPYSAIQDPRVNQLSIFSFQTLSNRFSPVRSFLAPITSKLIANFPSFLSTRDNLSRSCKTSLFVDRLCEIFFSDGRTMILPLCFGRFINPRRVVISGAHKI